MNNHVWKWDIEAAVHKYINKISTAYTLNMNSNYKNQWLKRTGVYSLPCFECTYNSVDPKGSSLRIAVCWSKNSTIHAFIKHPAGIKYMYQLRKSWIRWYYCWSNLPSGAGWTRFGWERCELKNMAPSTSDWAGNLIGELYIWLEHSWPSHRLEEVKWICGNLTWWEKSYYANWGTSESQMKCQ